MSYSIYPATAVKIAFPSCFPLLPGDILLSLVKKSPFLSYSQYLKSKYGEPVYRVAVDAGFSCPNRGDDRSRHGCSYCEVSGSRAPYLGSLRDIKSQIQGAISFLKKRYSARKYILYFQAYSNTFAPPDRLKRIYDSALSTAPFLEIIVATRPDCLSPSIVDLLASYKELGIDVWTEIGLQSASEITLKRIKRGHTVADFIKAFNLLKERNIKTGIHLIFGLPGEGLEEILNTVTMVASLKPDGLKIHNLHIPNNTILFQEYLMGEITVPLSDRHLFYTIKALELLPPSTVITRLTCDTPEERLASPRNFLPKAQFYSKLRREMEKQNTWQGKYFPGVTNKA